MSWPAPGLGFETGLRDVLTGEARDSRSLGIRENLVLLGERGEGDSKLGIGFLGERGEGDIMPEPGFPREGGLAREIGRGRFTAGRRIVASISDSISPSCSFVSWGKGTGFRNPDFLLPVGGMRIVASVTIPVSPFDSTDGPSSTSVRE